MSLEEKRKELVNKAASRIGSVKEKYAGVAADITAEIVSALNERVDAGYKDIVVFVDYANHTNSHAFCNWLFGRKEEISAMDMKLIWEVVRSNLVDAGFHISNSPPLVGFGLEYVGRSMKRTEYWYRRYDSHFGVSIIVVKPAITASTVK